MLIVFRPSFEVATDGRILKKIKNLNPNWRGLLPFHLNLNKCRCKLMPFFYLSDMIPDGIFLSDYSGFEAAEYSHITKLNSG
jgi:hypothetical protein